ncbi:hypothetical protein ACHWQZ_G011836 [Mnemiopsis leidyi]
MRLQSGPDSGSGDSRSGDFRSGDPHRVDSRWGACVIRDRDVIRWIIFDTIPYRLLAERLKSPEIGGDS